VVREFELMIKQVKASIKNVKDNREEYDMKNLEASL